MAATKGASLREKARAAATDLLVIRGVKGFSFNLLADAVGTTSANLHYHFGTKMALVENVLDTYATDTATRFRAVWLDDGADFAARVRGTFRFNKARFETYNGRRAYGRPWSLIARMRTDQEALSPAAVEHLRRFSRALEADVRAGVENCVARGDLRDDTPVRDVVLQLTSIVNSAGPITQDTGGIDNLEALYEAFLATVIAAYGPR